MNIKGILFDLDGTLANTVPLCITAYKRTFEPFLGRVVKDEEITTHFGISEEGIIQRVIPNHVDEGLKLYHDIYEDLHAHYSEPFAGIKTALDLLRQRGIKMAVVTGKGAHTAHLTLKYLGIDSYFDTVEVGDARIPVKAMAIKKILATWHVEPQDAAYVGDADTDMLEATEAGVVALAARWSETATIHRLSSMAPFASFNTVQDFINWLEEHIPNTNFLV